MKTLQITDVDCRFDVDDKLECDEICKNLPAGSSIDITEEAVARSLSPQLYSEGCLKLS